MKKVILNVLDIYKVSLKNGNELLKIHSDDFHINHCLHFPILIKDDESLWKHGNLYLLSKLKSYKPIASATLDGIATDLRFFYEFCDEKEIDYISAKRKIFRPTYLYRGHLQGLFENSKIASSTLKRRISSVVGFYKYLIHTENIKFKFPLWETGLTHITYQNNYGDTKYKEVTTMDITKVQKAAKIDVTEDYIIDGGKLHPLEAKEQKELLKALKEINNVEMLYGFLIALTTGARIQTVFTLRAKHFERTLLKEDKEVRIKVGDGTSCDTKNGKNYTLMMPIWLYKKIKIYLISDRYLKRRDKSQHIFESHKEQYLFITNRGRPYYVAKNDKYRVLYKNPANGTTVREFTHGVLKRILEKNGHKLTYSFHDLRSTFGMNLFDSLIKLVETKELEISYILLHIRDRMGHSSVQTTEQYLNFRNKHKVKQQVQNDFEKFMEGLLDD